jgi:hypothetical protein
VERYIRIQLASWVNREVEGDWELVLTQYSAHDMDINSIKWNPQVGLSTSPDPHTFCAVPHLGSYKTKAHFTFKKFIEKIKSEMTGLYPKNNTREQFR